MAGEEWTYERAGVSIDRGDQAVRRIRQLVGQTRRPEVVEDVGGFAGVFRLPGTDLVAGADGVGSKILIAEALGEYRTIGIDLVAMNVNDILAAGAEPLFFLDYIATGHVDPDVIGDLVAGMVEGCRQAGCALLGGETAEMPDVYGTHHDLAGFAVGRRVHSPRRAPAVGDKIFGVASSGFHSNGYQLVRKLVESQTLSYEDPWPRSDAARLGDQFVNPHPHLCSLGVAAITGRQSDFSHGAYHRRRAGREFAAYPRRPRGGPRSGGVAGAGFNA